MDARWKHPFTCIVAGPTGCGKSTFVTRMLRHAAAMIDPPPERITWCYGEWQEAYATMDLVDVRFEEGLPNASMFDSSMRNLIVIDDLMAETDERVMTLFTKKSHHRNTSVLYLVQNLFPQNKESRSISLNSQYMVVFKNPRDASQMSHLARQMYPGRVISFKRLLKTLRRYRTAIYWSISNRTRPKTCVCARPSFQTTVFSTCTCRRYKKTACVDSLFIHTMSDLVKRHIVCIQALNRIKSNKLKRAIIANADADLLCAIAECAYNILKKNIPLTELQRRRLSKYRTKLRELAQRRTPAARRRRILLQQQVGEG